MRPDELVLRFLTSIGRPAEAQVYLQAFRAARPESFALIAVSDTVMEQASGALVTDLRFLARLDLTPVVVLGVTDPADGERHARTLADRLEPEVDARVVAPAEAGDAARAGAIPLVPIGQTGQSTEAAFAALTDLARELASRKVVFLGRRSGLQPKDRPTPSLVDINTDYEALVAPGVLPAKQAALLARVRDLLTAVSHRMTVSVTSPLDLLRELFTERGAGTLIRLGSNVQRLSGYADVDRGRLEQLIAEAFGKQVAPSIFERDVAALYLADDYRGAAVIEATDLAGYLGKFAVGLAARGEGVGRDLFRALAADFPRLFWRARRDNPIATWYAQRADGLHRTSGWTVYWRGLEPTEIAAAIDLALRAPVDFPDAE